MKIYNVINPQRQRTKLGISALGSTSPAAPHPTGELVKCSSKSRIDESYPKTSVLNCSVQNRQSVQPPLHQDSLKIWNFRISTDTFQLEIPSLCRHHRPSCCSWLHRDWDSSASPEIYRQKDDSWVLFSPNPPQSADFAVPTLSCRTAAKPQ